MKHSPLCTTLLAAISLGLVVAPCPAQSPLRAGASAIDITPQKFPAIIAGGFLEGQSSTITDKLHTRSLVLDDGSTKIALVIVDSCMMPRPLIDEAKEIASRATGIPTDHMLVSATHTHSAPAAMSCLGTRLDVDYAKWLPGKIAEGIIAAHARLQPARIGWAVVDDWEHTHCRRWIRRPDRMQTDPFGQLSVRAMMHPGHESPDVTGPSGPVDPALSVISVQTAEGKPMAFFANYSQHYFGAKAVSADYYGAFARHIARLLNQPGSEGPEFVAGMTQGTSGDQQWMDYAKPRRTISMDAYAEEVAQRALEAYAKIEHRAQAPLAMTEKRLTLNYRVPDEQRLAWARPIAAKIENDLPKDKPEVYAKEALILHERQKTEIKLQVLRIGDLAINALPNEVYAITGLKLKAQSPLPSTINIELANGGEGYIPPPEQHALGGYTTWPARTAGLEVEAEPKMVETLLGALEEVTGKKRRDIQDDPSAYARAVLDAKPAAYWRLNDIFGPAKKGSSGFARNAVAGGPLLQTAPPTALYLPGPGSGEGEVLTPSAFSGVQQINRAIHLAGEAANARIEKLGGDYSIALWFWNAMPQGVKKYEKATLFQNETTGESLEIICDETRPWRLACRNAADESVAGSRALQQKGWHFVALVRKGDSVTVHLDGAPSPEIQFTTKAKNAESAALKFGFAFEGKLDEIAVFDRALAPAEIAAFWKTSGIAEQRERETAARAQAEKEAAARMQPLQFPATYAAAIAALHPIAQTAFDVLPPAMTPEGGVQFSPTTFATFDTGRVRGTATELGVAFSVSLWFRNEIPNESRAVTAYLFSRGPNGNQQAPGDHLGIGGTYRADLAGRLLVFNGNASNQVVAGRTVIPLGTWNHAVLVRDGKRVRAYLNGGREPDIDAELDTTAPGVRDFFLGARCDQFAPLKGHLAQFALFNRALTPEEAQKLHAASGQPIGAPKATANPPVATQRTSEPLTPEESLKKIHVRADCDVQLVAAEPLVLDPVAFDWDEHGRMWVVEMADYPLGMDGKGAPGGRIRILSDPDKNGRYTKSVLFAEGLNFPTGILTWRDGVIVTAAPDILLLRDTNGDDKADERKVLFTGFSEGNQQLRVNGLRWGMDGWVYCAGGAHNGNYNKTTQIESKLTGEKISLGSRDFRFRPDTGEFDPQSGPSQFGRCRDDWDHWFGVQNSFPLWHYVLQDHYVRRNPDVISPDPVKQLFTRNPLVYPASSQEKRFHSFGEAGRFTSACGVEIYRDNRLFADGKMHAFTCEPFHNVVQHHVLEDDGVSFRASRDPVEKEHDFFASEDRWCRPVMVRTGPDGALYVADMYRYMIEHPQWLPQNGKDELLPHYRAGDDKGRIYRIARKAPANGETTLRVSLPASTPTGMVDALSSSNGWLRDKAEMMLLWKKPGDIEAALNAATENASPRTRLQAAWTLDALGLLRPDTVERLLRDADARVREQALILAEKHPSPAVIESAAKLVADADAKVRLQLACSLGAWKDARAGDALAALIQREADNPTILGAAMSSLPPHLKALANMEIGGAFEPVLATALAAKDDAALESLLRRLASENGGAFAKFERFHALLTALQRRNITLDTLAREAKSKDLKQQLTALDVLFSAAAQLNPPRESKVADRALLLELSLLDPAHRADGLRRLNQLLDSPDAAEQETAITLLARHAPRESQGKLLAKWSGATPAQRSLLLEALMGSNLSALALLEHVKNGTISAQAFDAQRQARLLNHPDAKVKALAAEVFQAAATSRRADVLARFKPALSLTGAAANGKVVFAQLCVSCHKLDGVGIDLGPDLRSVAQHDPEKLLNSILDPSAIIEPGFMAYHCTLKNGEELYGVVATETSNSITLKLPGNVIRPILRSDIASLKSANMSLMPDGLEAALTPQSLADLIAYLKLPR